MARFASLTAQARALAKRAYYSERHGRVLRQGAAAYPRLALTFDDGPGPLTNEYLAVLDRYNVPATFFVQGNHLEQHPTALREYLRRGHQVASHGYEHEPFPKQPVRRLHTQLAHTDRLIGAQLTGRPWVRPPYGASSARTVAQLLASGRVIAMWSFDTLDYQLRTEAELLAHCTEDAVRPGDVVLMHEDQPWTLAALGTIIERWRGAGFDFVTMADLFAR